MAIYVAVWSINKQGASLDAARERFMSRLAVLDHVRNPTLADVAWISTYLTVADLEAFLAEALDGEDAIFVSDLRRGGYQGWLRSETWAWLEARL